jgi:hypothetical protein
MTDPVLESIARTRRCPAMYFGEHSAKAMFLYLAGYCGALQDHTNFDLTQYGEFIETLYAKYGRGGGGHSWASVLAEKTGSDAAALGLFFDELEAFLMRKA